MDGSVNLLYLTDNQVTKYQFGQNKIFRLFI